MRVSSLFLSVLTKTTENESITTMRLKWHRSKPNSCFTHELICFFLSFFYKVKLQWIIDWPQCSLQCRSGARRNQRLQAHAIFLCNNIPIGRKVVMDSNSFIQQIWGGWKDGKCNFVFVWRFNETKYKDVLLRL